MDRFVNELQEAHKVLRTIQQEVEQWTPPYSIAQVHSLAQRLGKVEELLYTATSGTDDARLHAELYEMTHAAGKRSDSNLMALKECILVLESYLADERVHPSQVASKIAELIYRLGQAIRTLDQLTKHSALITDKQSPPGNEKPSAKPLTEGPVYITHIHHAKGIAIGNGARVERPERKPAAAQPAPPSVSVSLLTRVIPTAYCHHLNATAFPLVTVALDNTGQGCANAALRVCAAIEGYSDPDVASLNLPQGEQTRIPLLPLLKPPAVATLNEIRPAILRVTVEQMVPTPRILHDRTERVHLHARDTALLAVKAPDGSIVDLTKYLIAWVTPRHPEIERLLRRAAEYHPDRRFVGYQGATTPTEAAEIVRKQARAIFTALKRDADLTYVNSPLSLGAQAGQITQRVRLPTESLDAGGSANCIDGTVLFASLLELASLQPLIVLVPGHAFVGWRIWRGVDRYEFLETTMIGSDDFVAAQRAGQAQYDEAVARGYFSRGLFDPGGFARLIDVAACRAEGIYPLE